MAIKSITHRWILNSLCVIIAIIIAIGFSLFLAIKNFYYSSSKQLLLSKSNAVNSILLKYGEDDNSNFYQKTKSFVQNFDNKNIIQLMALDYTGKTIITSSGYSDINNFYLPDYEQAIKSDTGITNYIGKLENGEKIMTVVLINPILNKDFSAFRFIISIKKIDEMLFATGLIIFFASLAVIIFVVVSGLYFIKSIVRPVIEIGDVARKISSGDLKVRLNKNSDDELGELCDIINLMADELSNSEKIKNEFISSVSHELRTPLTAIKGWGETLLTIGDGEYDTLKKGMGVIISETERLSSMVEELLDFSRIQSGRLILVKTQIDILAEIGEAVLIYAQRAKRDGIELIYNEPDMMLFVFGDKNRLRQVFINVIDNALKYSDNGDSVTVEVFEQDGFINITVEDTGCGISDEDLPKITTKFYKANLTRRGSGIGLAVVNEIINLHDGKLIINSEQSVGTVVTIKLPVNIKKLDNTNNDVKSLESKEGYSNE